MPGIIGHKPIDIGLILPSGLAPNTVKNDQNVDLTTIGEIASRFCEKKRRQNSKHLRIQEEHTETEDNSTRSIHSCPS
ncbi:MAG: hypothetical protein Q6363_009980 [Candidatus Njordarchaeota archaeon]